MASTSLSIVSRLLLPMLCDPNGIHETEAIGALCVTSNSKSMSISIILLFVRKIFVPPIYTFSTEAAGTSLNVLGNFRKKQKNFLSTQYRL